MIFLDFRSSLGLDPDWRANSRIVDSMIAHSIDESCKSGPPSLLDDREVLNGVFSSRHIGAVELVPNG